MKKKEEDKDSISFSDYIRLIPRVIASLFVMFEYSEIQTKYSLYKCKPESEGPSWYLRGLGGHDHF